MGIFGIILVVCWIVLRSMGLIRMPWDNLPNNPPSPPVIPHRSKEEWGEEDEIRSSVGLDLRDNSYDDNRG